MQEVYRVQDSKGRGPYTNGYDCDAGGWDWFIDPDRSHSDDDHPNPFEDGIYETLRDRNKKMDAYLCGFKSMEQLTDWFTATELKRLEVRGYTVYKIETKEIIHGRKQIMFLPKEN